jgi:hypothetical protein
VRFHVLDVSATLPHIFGVSRHSFCAEGGLADAAGFCPEGDVEVGLREIAPLRGVTVAWIERLAGRFSIGCLLSSHAEGGMTGWYEVLP